MGLRRWIYGLVGISAVGALVSAFMGDWPILEMNTWSIIASVLLLAGGLNWLVVALSGSPNKDLFYYLGLKKI